MVYSLDIVDINVGDTVTWLPTAKGHNVQIIAGPDSAELPRKSKLNKKFTHQFDVPGVYLYQCTPHKAMGMIGLVVVGDNTNNKDAIASTKVNGKSKKKLAKLISELE
jgi:pseudoazurin